MKRLQGLPCFLWFIANSRDVAATWSVLPRLRQCGCLVRGDIKACSARQQDARVAGFTCRKAKRHNTRAAGAVGQNVDKEQALQLLEQWTANDATQDKLGVSLGNAMRSATRCVEGHHSKPALLAMFRTCAAKLVSQAAFLDVVDLVDGTWAVALLSLMDILGLTSVANSIVAEAEHLTARNLAEFSWACAKLRCKTHDIVVVVGQSAAKRTEFSPRGLANLLWAFAHLRLDGARRSGRIHRRGRVAGGAKFFAEVEGGSRVVSREPDGQGEPAEHPWLALLDEVAVRAHQGALSPRDIANILWSLAKLHRNEDEVRGSSEHDFVDWRTESSLARLLVSKAVDNFVGFGAQEVSNVAWSSAVLSVAETPLLRAIGETIGVLRSRISFSSQGLANIAWAFATASYDEEPSIIRHLSADADRKLQTFAPQELVNLAWALSTLAALDARMHLSIAQAGSGKVALFKAQELANIAWAFAHSAEGTTVSETIGGVEAHAFCSAVIEESSPRLPEFKPQELSSLAWAAAKMAMTNPGFTSAAMKEAIRQLIGFKPQELSNIAWAFALLKAAHPEFFQLVADRADVWLPDMAPQHLSNFAWAFATLGTDCPTLMRDIASVSAKCIRKFSTQGLANLAWSFAAVAVEDRTLLGAIVAQSVGKLKEFAPQGLGGLVWACARLGVQDPEVLHAIQGELALGLGRNMDVKSARTQRSLPKLTTASSVSPTNYSVHIDSHISAQFVSTEVDRGGVDRLGAQGMPFEMHLPQILLDLPDRLVLHKPVGWEIDGLQEGAPAGLGAGRKMSQHWHAIGFAETWPLLKDVSRTHGAIHRLDVPCSGLLLVAKSYEAYYDLKFQLDADLILREYLVVCHGWLPLSKGGITARVQWTQGDVGPTLVRRAGGRPAETRLTLVAQASGVDAAFVEIARTSS